MPSPLRRELRSPARVATLVAKGTNPALLDVVNDNDFDLAHTVDVTKTSIPERVETVPYRSCVREWLRDRGRRPLVRLSCVSGVTVW
jgi:hypothetical protein